MASTKLGKIGVFLVLPIILILIWLIIRAGDAATEIAESMAAIEASQAAQSAAEAAQIASRGLATVSVIQSIVLAIIVIAAVILVGLAVYLVLEQRANKAQITTLLDQQKRKWVPGPNAHFAKVGDVPALPQGNLTEQMIQLLVAQQLGQLQSPRAPMLSNQVAVDEYDDNYLDDLWGGDAK